MTVAGDVCSLPWLSCHQIGWTAVCAASAKLGTEIAGGIIVRALRLTILLVFGAMPLMAASPTRFAILGDFGVDNANELAVANLVKTNFQPEFVVTVGDNNYIGATNIDEAIGKYYHQFIGNYAGGFGAGASSNRFFPALGNHDYEAGTGYAAHTNYFTLPGNERYYDFVRGPVHFFILNSDSNEPNGNTATSTQALWFSNRINSSTSPWRIVICQDPPYSSTQSLLWMRWPFEEWGASIVVSGDSHNYERLVRGELTYVVNGTGGTGLAGFGTPIAGSMVRYGADHGAMLVTATATNIVYEFWSVAGGGTLIDRFSDQWMPSIAVMSATNRFVVLSWPTNGTDGCVLQSAQAMPCPATSWVAVSQSPVIVGASRTVTLSTTGDTARYFRLRK
jgi:hypothetical protein